MKDGKSRADEEDLNALMAMLIMQYAANRPAFMGNPNHETDELLRIHHAVPALCMNGYGTNHWNTNCGHSLVRIWWKTAGLTSQRTMMTM